MDPSFLHRHVDRFEEGVSTGYVGPIVEPFADDARRRVRDGRITRLVATLAD